LGRKAVPRRQALDAKPILNPAVEWRTGDGGGVIVTVMRRTDWWVRLLSLAFYVPREREVALDEIGSAVWRMMEEPRTVGEMAAELGARYGLQKREAEAALFHYLRTLAKRRLIAMELSVDR